MKPRPELQFSLAQLLLWVAAVATLLGLVFGLSRAQQRAIRQARFEAQERLVAEVGGNVLGYAKNLNMPTAIDLSNANVNTDWIKTWLGLHETPEIRTMIVNHSLANDSGFADLAKQFPNARFLVADKPNASPTTPSDAEPNPNSIE